MDFLSSLFSIIILDLVLAGDNAVVIAMAAHQLPEELRKKATLVGTGGAVAVRIVMTLLAVYLLSIPYLQAAGGLLLLPVAVKLLKPAGEEKHIEAAVTFSAAVKTIIVADAAMGIDNVLAVAGAAGGSYLLVIVGLVISVPIVVGASQIIGVFLDKWPVFIYLGAGILGWTSGNMIVHDASVGPYFMQLLGGEASHIVSAVLAIMVCSIGFCRRRSSNH